jgi:hypothetical protein
MSSGHPIVYDQNYIRQCFDIWYLNGRPTFPAKLRELVPVHESTGRKPSKIQLRRWMIDGAWDMWADDLDARANAILDDDLVSKKADMLRQHQKDAEIIAKKALEAINDNGFDTSSAAVTAYFKATEEQRKTAGFSDLLEKLDKMTNNDVERAIIEKFNRIKENDQIIDVGEAEDIEQLESGEE